MAEDRRQPSPTRPGSWTRSGFWACAEFCATDMQTKIAAQRKPMMKTLWRSSRQVLSYFAGSQRIEIGPGCPKTALLSVS